MGLFLKSSKKPDLDSKLEGYILHSEGFSEKSEVVFFSKDFLISIILSVC